MISEPSETGDQDLLSRARAGDEESFTVLYRRRQACVYRFALQMSGSPSVAEEVTQEVFLTVIRDAGRFDPQRGTLLAYLYGIARNQVLRSFERDRLYVPMQEEPECEGSQWTAREDTLGDLTRDETIESVRQAVHGRRAAVYHGQPYARASGPVDRLRARQRRSPPVVG